LRADPEITSTPVLMMTALTRNSQLSNEEAAESTGANLFLHKPFELDDLLEAIEKLTGVKV
ncbi:MAG: two-component system response regulator, partial [Candidatus Sumerlaeia bacterium]|nr:two-component system response regulator [Candidatus Sumerlaeia bacterium]